MRTRTAILAALAIAVTATPAVAAKKPPPKVCNLLVDAKGDGQWDMTSVVASDRLDIVSADIATGKSEFVAVLRVVNANLSGDNWANLGYTWRMQATGLSTKYNFEVRKPAGTSTNLIHTAAIGGNAVEHTFQVVGNTFVWRFKRAAAGAAMTRPKLFWTDFTASSLVLSTTADTADVSKKKYADKTPSCVVAK